MKKILFFTFAILLSLNVLAVDEFSTALKTCEKFSRQGSIPYDNQMFNVLVTLDKNRKNECIYKERIFQGDSFQQLNCKFSSADLPKISSSMEEFNRVFKKQIDKNPIFGAKMTTNAEVFQAFLANPKYCEITYSKKSQLFN